MRILALETSLHTGSVALFEADRLAGQLDLPGEPRTAQTLAPAIRDVLDEAGWRAEQVHLVAVTIGPGSFTGLRVGVTTARTFAYAVGSQVVGINTLEVIARQSQHVVGDVWAVMDAQRSELFAARFARHENGHCELILPTSIIARDVWLASLDGCASVTGPGLAGMETRLPAGLATPSGDWLPRAETVGRIGWLRHQAGLVDDVWTLLPDYCRRSAAEEKLR